MNTKELTAEIVAAAMATGKNTELFEQTVQALLDREHAIQQRDQQMKEALDDVAVRKAEAKQVWLAAWTACARADNCSRIEAPTEYADRCLADFRNRFHP